MHKTGWIGVDWGTSHLRAFAVDDAGAMIGHKTSECGMARLEPGQFEPALLDLITPWLDGAACVPVFACGMVGARQGWCEVPYRAVPCPPVAADGLTFVATIDQRIKVHVIAGLSQNVPADVMRGEETQIAGLVMRQPDYCGAVCLPGTHSKWVRVEAGKVRGFTTFMTGELFDTLATRTVLRHSVTSRDFESAAFLEAALKAAERPGQMAAELFGLRARGLLCNAPPHTARAQLSGYLIGQELGLAHGYRAHHRITLIGSNQVVRLYKTVLEALGEAVHVEESTSATLSGLSRAAAIGDG